MISRTASRFAPARILLCVFALAGLVVPVAVSRAGAPGDLDPEFGNGGRFKGPSGYATSIAAGPGGDLYVTGCLGPCNISNTMFLAKYLPTGALDTSFGTESEQGRVLIPGARGRSVLFQGAPYNQVLLAAELDDKFALFRINLDGSPDQTFGTAGRFVLDEGSGAAAAIALQGNKILAAGSSGGDIKLVRLEPNDAGVYVPDADFGTNGVVTTDTGTLENATSLVLHGSRIYVGGFTGHPAIPEQQLSLLAAYGDNGSPDANFGQGGMVTGSARRINALAVQQNKLVAAGQTSATGILNENVQSDDDKPWMGRFEAGGLPDPGFGTAGSTNLSPPGSFLSILAADGNIVTAIGRNAIQEPNGAHTDGYKVGRFTGAGALDTSFGSGGIVNIDFGEAVDEAASLTIQPGANKFVAAGRSGEFSSYQVALARYEKDAIASRADLGVQVTGFPETIVEGGSIEYQIRVTNHGPESAFKTVLTNTLGTNVRFEGTKSEIGLCSGSGREVTCSLESIAPGASSVIFVQVQTTSVGVVENLASVSSTSSDPRPADNSVLSRTRVDPAPGKWTPGPDLGTERAGHRAVLLAGPACEASAQIKCGSALVLSGSSAEVYDPLTNSWRTAGALPFPAKEQFSATLLADGRVLVAGGRSGTSSIDYQDGVHIFDPRTAGWRTARPLERGRFGHAAVLLSDGKVLVAGGKGEIDQETCADAVEFNLRSAEIYDPATDRWALTEPMTHLRGPILGEQTLTVLRSGLVLAVGGHRGQRFDREEPEDPCDDNAGPLAPPEVFDPSSGQWAPTGEMGVNRVGHTATLLRNGSVLAAGGTSTSFTSGLTTRTAEVFLPEGVGSNGFRGAWKPTSSIAAGSAAHTANLLSDGRVLVAGGQGTRVFGNNPDARAEVFNRTEMYDPAAARWSSGGLMNTERFLHTSTLFPPGPLSLCGVRCGTILATGGNRPAETGQGATEPMRSTEIYTLKPSISAISPPTGTILGGTQVTISGTGLAGLTKVTFEGEPPLLCGPKGAARCWVDDELPDLKVHAISPPHAIPEKVHVVVETLPGFSSVRTEADLFGYEALPGRPVPGPPPGAQGEQPPPTLPTGTAGSANSPNPGNSPVSAVRAPALLPAPGPAVASAAPAEVPQFGSQLGQELVPGFQAGAAGQAGLLPGAQSQNSAGLADRAEQEPRPAPRISFSRLEQQELAHTWGGGAVLAAGIALCLLARRLPSGSAQPAPARALNDRPGCGRIAI